VIVVDASVLAPALADDGPDGDLARARLRGERLCAPSLVDLEAVSVLRRAVATGRLHERRSAQALADLALLPLERVGHVALLDRIWELRENVTVYDGAYIALAELIGATFLTADARLARSPGTRCEIEVLSPP
jgi:predicted nucleic acid-binding protein